MKVNTIVFSKDRPSQLNLLLDSIQKNVKPADVLDISVIYRFTTERYKQGYDILKAKFSGINFMQQSDTFKQDVITCLTSPHKYTMFFTDDDVVFRPADIEKAVDVIEKDDNIFCFSLRLGKNVNWCYTLNGDNKLVALSESDGVVKWDWTKHYADFGYPLSVDAHIFRTAEIKKLTTKVAFTNPNLYEGGLQIFEYFPREHMAAFEENSVVGIPNNIVNETHPNINATQYGITARVLNDKYLESETIDLDAMSFLDIKGCHQEIAYIFKKNN